MKRTPLKRKTALKAKTPQSSKVATKKKKLPTIKTMRNKCDKLLTPIIKAVHPYCILTGEPTEVAHHHVHKSQSNNLRYNLQNLIPLTHKAHQRLHHNESYWASKIVEIKGIEWFQDLEKKKNETVKCDVHWYIEQHERLKKIHDELLKK